MKCAQVGPMWTSRWWIVRAKFWVLTGNLRTPPGYLILAMYEDFRWRRNVIVQKCTRVFKLFAAGDQWVVSTSELAYHMIAIRYLARTLELRFSPTLNLHSRSQNAIVRTYAATEPNTRSPQQLSFASSRPYWIIVYPASRRVARCACLACALCFRLAALPDLYWLLGCSSSS